MTTTNDIGNAVRQAVIEHVPEGVVDSVFVEPGRDEDGDKIYRILAVYNDPTQTPQTHSSFGLVGRLRPRPKEMNIDGFPIISFMSRNEAAKMRREPA